MSSKARIEAAMARAAQRGSMPSALAHEKAAATKPAITPLGSAKPAITPLASATTSTGGVTATAAAAAEKPAVPTPAVGGVPGSSAARIAAAMQKAVEKGTQFTAIYQSKPQVSAAAATKQSWDKTPDKTQGSTSDIVPVGINATAELPEVEGKTLDAPEFVEPPEHLVGAISGSMRMKRFLELDMDEARQEFQRMDLLEELGAKAKSEGLDEPLPKKRRLMTLEPESLCSWNENEDEDIHAPYSEEEKQKMEKIDQILKRWKLTDNYGSRWALETQAFASDVEKFLKDVTWKPDTKNQMHSIAELVISRIKDALRASGPPLFSVDAVKTFTFKWGLEKEDSEKLVKLQWNELKYVIDYYDGTESIDELVEASHAEDDPWPVALPGIQSQIRTMRLELIDGSSDCLVLGDANLTFSSLLSDHRADLGHTGKVIATTFEDFKTLSIRYKELARTIKNLLKNEAQIWHGVDCTRLAVDTRFHGFEESFGAVYYNFPHAGAVKGFYDSHPFVNWRHANLMALFFRAISYFVKPGAIVKVSSNARAKGVQAQYIVMGAEHSDFMHIETFPFTDWVLRRYHRSYGDKRDEKVRPDADSYRSQQAAADMVYCFRYVPTGQKESTGVPIHQPPTICEFIEDVMCCKCGYICHKELASKQKDNLGGGQISNALHFKPSGMHLNMTGKDKRKMVVELYQRFLTEASGIHIG
eukprot:gnl/MRDRNA2_/MRDRNA2_36285_c0_seq1.p1 gnl/MRDRNA2_/MRDRNA2_36285_c0~~gnl/MRDRNA2_/MRDRNA2_36285_c0_seq1.p1  ORF type:complete len:702 (+),score=134.50 gnl/MRDRNA2_/MRDRNA2_36285_c0_seq1:67-2172(+)